MEDGHIFCLKTAGEANAGVLTGSKNSVQDLLGPEILHRFGDLVYVHSIHLFLILSRFDKPESLRKRQNTPRGCFFGGAEFQRTRQVKITAGEFSGEATLCLLRECTAGIEGDESGHFRPAKRLGNGAGGKFGIAQMEDLRSRV